jgi:hypothetical protein
VQTYVQPFPSTGAKHLVGVGIHPLWSRDGAGLLVLTPDAVVGRRVSTAGFALSNPSRLSNVRLRVIGPNVERNYDFLPDGRLVGVLGDDAAGRSPQPSAVTPHLQVVVNWFDELRRMVAAK